MNKLQFKAYSVSRYLDSGTEHFELDQPPTKMLTRGNEM